MHKGYIRAMEGGGSKEVVRVKQIRVSKDCSIIIKWCSTPINGKSDIESTINRKLYLCL